jgi:hypothetical protein
MVIILERCRKFGTCRSVGHKLYRVGKVLPPARILAQCVAAPGTGETTFADLKGERNEG